MPEIILHIGCHKTGTTSLQHFLSLNAEVLLKREGILYPLTGRSCQKHFHHPIFRDVIVAGQKMNQELAGGVLEEAGHRGASRILLSSEMLSRWSVRKDQLCEIRDSFNGNPISIIVYLRRQDALLQSMYAERVKRGFIAAPEGIYDIKEDLDYYVLIQKYASVFGKSAITIRIYENAVKTSIFKDFFDALGVTFDSEYLVRQRNLNVHLPWIYIELLRYANVSKLARKIVYNPIIRMPIIKLGQILPDITDHPKPMTASEIESVIERYNESNNRLAREYKKRRELFGSDKEAFEHEIQDDYK